MKILATPDDEDQELDPLDPLGTLCIEDDDGAQLLETIVMLEEWFSALICGMGALMAGEKRFEAEMDSYPDPLVWEVKGDRILLSYKTSRIIIGNLPGFATLLKKAILAFTEAYTAHQNWPRSHDLRLAREWAENEAVE